MTQEQIGIVSMSFGIASFIAMIVIAFFQGRQKHDLNQIPDFKSNRNKNKQTKRTQKELNKFNWDLKMNSGKHKYKFKFETTSNCIKDDKTDFGKFDIMCWNFEKNECGTIFGSGIDWSTRTINRNKIGFLNTSPLKKGYRKDEDVLRDFLKALRDDSSSQFTEIEGIVK